ncbi:hypothetical protein AVEN_239240-1 [Araneus ventricosus]|uniref:Uncharacterized protein n=1 Tax=Araneus ventricosus TaxID=182803 RepID=A0A4Y2J858_ARAVE|nr:hypothetical protein AVEN_239240-1 [Araneus ventricosus]
MRAGNVRIVDMRAGIVRIVEMRAGNGRIVEMRAGNVSGEKCGDECDQCLYEFCSEGQCVPVLKIVDTGVGNVCEFYCEVNG